LRAAFYLGYGSRVVIVPTSSIKPDVGVGIGVTSAIADVRRG